MTCTSCRKSLKPTAVFCSGCGVRIAVQSPQQHGTVPHHMGSHNIAGSQTPQSGTPGSCYPQGNFQGGTFPQGTHQWGGQPHPGTYPDRQEAYTNKETRRIIIGALEVIAGIIGIFLVVSYANQTFNTFYLFGPPGNRTCNTCVMYTWILIGSIIAIVSGVSTVVRGITRSNNSNLHDNE